MSEAAFPLSWPTGWRRTPADQRKRGNFSKKNRDSSRSYAFKADITLADAVGRVLGELRRMGVPECDVLISTNVALRLDGLPRSGQRAPEDPGASVYWQDGRQRRCMAVDLYTKVEHNLAAIAATLEYLRGIERHGGATILDRAFTGFAALPYDTGAARLRTWRDVLGVDPMERDLDRVKAAWRRLASTMHPDKGGSDAAMAELNDAMAQAVKELTA